MERKECKCGKDRVEEGSHALCEKEPGLFWKERKDPRVLSRAVGYGFQVRVGTHNFSQ